MGDSNIKFVENQGIQLAQLPIYDKRYQSGIIKLLPNISKETRKASYDIVCTDIVWNSLIGIVYQLNVFVVVVFRRNFIWCLEV